MITSDPRHAAKLKYWDLSPQTHEKWFANAIEITLDPSEATGTLRLTERHDERVREYVAARVLRQPARLRLVFDVAKAHAEDNGVSACSAFIYFPKSGDLMEGDKFDFRWTSLELNREF